MLLGGPKKRPQRHANLDAQKQQTGLAEGKDKPFTKEVVCLGRDRH